LNEVYLKFCNIKSKNDEEDDFKEGIDGDGVK
jgi:hypothetical protein